jgi:hypothetical protein
MIRTLEEVPSVFLTFFPGVEVFSIAVRLPRSLETPPSNAPV